MSPTLRPFREVPSPYPRARLRHLRDWVGKRQASQVLTTLKRYAEARGGLVRIPLGPTTLLLVSDPDLVHKALSCEEANYKGWSYRLTRVVLDNVLLLNGEVWSRHRQLYRRALMGVDVATSADRALERLALAPDGRQRVDAALMARTFAADVVTELLCGEPWPARLDDARDRIQYELAGVGIDLQCQPWAYLSVARWRALRGAVREVRAFFLGAVRRRLARQERGRDALQGMIDAEGQQPAVTAATGHSREEYLRDGLVNIFFTAHDVLSSALGFCLYLVAQHPAVEERLSQSLDQPYLDQVVRESLRLFPGYPLFGRRTGAPIELGGYHIPAGIELLVLPWVVHRLECLWPNAERFDPDRWLGRAEGVPPPGPRDAYFPFGGGRRACIAAQLAYPLLKLALSRIVTDHRLRPVPDHEPLLAYWGSAFSENGLPLDIEPRLVS
jgi:cytochrome P450